MSDQEEIYKSHDRFKEEHLEDILKEYGLVSNPDLEKRISEIIGHILGPEADIRICICENMLPLAITLTGPDERTICVNSDESKDLLQSEEGISIVYMTLAHEIGHIHYAQKTNYHYEETLEWRLNSEIKADEIAWVLMQKIVNNPREILLKQIDRAFNKMFKIKTTQVKIDLAVAIHEARRNALMKNQFS